MFCMDQINKMTKMKNLNAKGLPQGIYQCVMNDEKAQVLTRQTINIIH
jgi:hypothetical protein